MPLWLAAAVTLCAGCSQSQIAAEVAAKNDANIKRVANLYTAYQFSNGYQGPKDEAALKEFAHRGLPPKNLEMMGINPSNLDEAFVSERDGQPFKIRSGVLGGMQACEAIVFEASGVNGKKLVGFNGAIVEEVDEPRYQELWEKGGRPLGLETGGVGPNEAPPGVDRGASG